MDPLEKVHEELVKCRRVNMRGRGVRGTFFYLTYTMYLTNCMYENSSLLISCDWHFPPINLTRGIARHESGNHVLKNCGWVELRGCYMYMHVYVWCMSPSCTCKHVVNVVFLSSDRQQNIYWQAFGFNYRNFNLEDSRGGRVSWIPRPPFFKFR